MPFIQRIGTIRQREPSAESAAPPPRQVRARMASPDPLASALAPNPSPASAAHAGAHFRAPRAQLPARLPDLNTALPEPPDLPDLNTALPEPPDLPDLNTALPEPPDLPDLNTALPEPPDLPDLNAALPATTVPSTMPSASSSQTSIFEEDEQSDADMSPDPLTLPYVDHAEFDIHGTPHSDQVFALLDRLNADPAQAQRVLRVSADLLVELGALPELRDGLEERARDETLHPATTAAIRQLMSLLVSFEDDDVESEDEDEGHESEELGRELKRQTKPLGWEIGRWLGQGEDSGAMHAFDEEAGSPAFARFLARLYEIGRKGASAASTSTAAAAVDATREQVVSVIHAVAGDPDLRQQVYLIAQTALGSCQDNVLEGFSKALLAVRNHQMVADIRSGRVDLAQFQRWAGQQFRLALLESEVTRFIHRELQRPGLGSWQRRQLTREPLETLMHAKQALRDRLDLPEGTVTGVQALQLSVLRQKDVHALEQAVVQQAMDAAAYSEFRMDHATWREGMKALYPRAFAQFQRERDDDPFFDEDIPTDLEGQVEYAIRARAVEVRWLREEDRLLRQLAGIEAPRGAVKPEPGAA